MGVISVGVDVAKRSFRAAAWEADAGRPLGEFPNSPEGFAQLERAVKRVVGRRRSDLRFTLEATAGYELHLAAFAHQAGWRVSMPTMSASGR